MADRSFSLRDPSLAHLSRSLKNCDRYSTIQLLSGLQTVLSLQSNNLRIETVSHLAVLHCYGSRVPTRATLLWWLNSALRPIRHLEDPVDDVFLTNVETCDGNYRVFEGGWTANAFYVQSVVDVLSTAGSPPVCRELLRSCMALLRISDYVAGRLDLNRWCHEESSEGGDVRLPAEAAIVRRQRAVLIQERDLRDLGVNRDDLEPFVFRTADTPLLLGETLGHTSLERHPLVPIEKGFILALPAAVSPAIRRFVLSTLQGGYLDSFRRTFIQIQTRKVDLDCLGRLKGRVEKIEVPSRTEMELPVNEWMLKIDTGKYVHIVLLHDDKMDIQSSDGLQTFIRWPAERKSRLERHLDAVADRCREFNDFTEGWTLELLGGIGRGVIWPARTSCASWHFSLVQLFDFEMLCAESRQPLVQFLKFTAQKDWVQQRGVSFSDVSDDYSTYCYWLQNGYRFAPDTVCLQSRPLLIVTGGFTLSIREESRRTSDPHGVDISRGLYFPTVRATSDSYFPYEHERSVYVSTKHVEMGVLAGVVETERGPSWLVTASTRNGGSQKKLFIYDFWKGFLDLYERLVVETELSVADACSDAIVTVLDFGSVVVSNDLEDLRRRKNSTGIRMKADRSKLTVTLKLPADILLHFNLVENEGERTILRAMARGLLSLHKPEGMRADDDVVDKVVDTALKSKAARVLHVFRARNALEHLIGRSAKVDPTFLALEEYGFCKTRLSYRRAPSGRSCRIQVTKECISLLNGMVADIWSQLKESLGQLDRKSAIRQVLLVHESSIADRHHWHRCASAMVALHSAFSDVYNVMRDRESERTNIQLPARTILEMALCECPTKGGRVVSRWNIDALLAHARLLLGVATDSDAIHHGLVKSGIEVHPSGDYSISRDFHVSTLEPFISEGLISEFRDAERRYSIYYEDSETRRTRSDCFSPEFSSGFVAEFGLTPEDVLDSVRVLIDWAIDTDQVVVETRLGEMKDRLSSARGTEVADAFVRSFGLFPRDSWENAVNGFSTKDIWPWRYSRRLSIVARPILVLGGASSDSVFYGVGTLTESVMHILTRAAEGRISPSFFVTREMRRYLGAATNRLGRQFTLEVAAKLRESRWLVRTEVSMTEIGASKKLGDIDVLAWKKDGRVLVIECKRLHLARTIAEIAEMCKRFRGEANDSLSKHIGRVHWIRNNLEVLQTIVGFIPQLKDVDDLLVTNVHVPMTYLSSLPIDPRKIGPLE